MKRTVLLCAVALALATASSLPDLQGTCGVWTKSETVFYDFSSIGNQQYTVNLPQSGNLTFQVCKTFRFNNQNTFAVVNNSLAITDSGDRSYSLINSDHPKDGITINYPQLNGNQFTLTLNCAKGADGPITVVQSTGGKYVLQWSNSAGCVSKQVSGLWTFLQQNKNWVAVFMLLIGLPLAFIGYKFLGMTIFLLSFLIVFNILMVCFSLITQAAGNPSWLNWFSLVISAVLSVIAGFFLRTCTTVGVCIIGACGGWYLGLLLYTSWFHIYGSSQLWMYIPCIVLAVIALLLTICIKTYVAMIITSFVGSYLIIRFISVYAGGFPNEMVIAQQIETGATHFPNSFYAYLASICVLWVLTFMAQFYHKRRGEHKEKSKSSDDYEQLSN